MSLLEALRNLDTPVEDGLEEVAGEIVSKRLGLSATVAAQISRYQDQVRRGETVSTDEVVAVFRLAGRRPDADLVFADAGRRTARYATRSLSLSLRGVLRALPGSASRRVGARAAAATARRFLGLELKVADGEFSAESRHPVSITAMPEGEACSFYGAALAEVLRQLTGFEGALIHDRCRGRGDTLCRWRAMPVGGYE
jgi:predicted hydrocarbon binding protein